ncbi:17735_t:CDS:1, partial [Funneliformis geosporum]
SRSNQRGRTRSESPAHNPSPAPPLPCNEDDDAENLGNIEGSNTTAETVQSPSYEVATFNPQSSTEGGNIA